MTNALSLARRLRPAKVLASGTMTEREFLDFVVDGTSLFDELRQRDYEFVSCLCGSLGSLESESRERLSLRRSGDLPSGRISLYVCPECGDSGCGTVSVRVSKQGTTIVWSEFGYENNYEEGFIPEPGIGPFEFDEIEYAKVVDESRPTSVCSGAFRG
jgi:hypothetical protein